MNKTKNKLLRIKNSGKPRVICHSLPLQEGPDFFKS